MTGRLREICALLTPCKTLADVGCDHGYCTQYAFKKGLCESAYISDISAGSLQKAERLLEKEIAAGRCFPVVCDGLQQVGDCDLVLIAGLGGEEIVRILSQRELPPRFVLQPMRNVDKVRAYLLERGASLERDYTFEDGGYFYDAITGAGTGGDTYSDFEILFGRENLRTAPRAFIKKILSEREKIKTRMARPMSAESRRALVEKLSILEVVTDALEEDL